MADQENTTPPETPEQATTPQPELPKMYTMRDWKEYLGESILIVFSVLLALFLTEYFNHLHDRENTHKMLKNIAVELKGNKKSIEEMRQYDLQVLARIDSALASTDLQHALVSNDEFHLNIIAPQGVLYRYLNNEAWTVAKSNNNILSKLDFETDALLTKVYEDQDRIMKVEDEVARVILDRASRDPKQTHTTLILIRDIYHGWAVDRIDGLLQQIEVAIKKIEPN
jgi:hypothetical protein